MILLLLTIWHSIWSFLPLLLLASPLLPSTEPVTRLRDTCQLLNDPISTYSYTHCKSSYQMKYMCHMYIVQDTSCHMHIVQGTRYHMYIVQDTRCHVYIVQGTRCHMYVVQDAICHTNIVQVTSCHMYIVQGTRCHMYIVQGTRCHMYIVQGTRCHMYLLPISCTDLCIFSSFHSLLQSFSIVASYLACHD